MPRRICHVAALAVAVTMALPCPVAEAAPPHFVGGAASPAETAQPKQVVAAAKAVWWCIKWIWGNLVPDSVKDKAKSFVAGKAVEVGRKLVARDTGKDVETITLKVTAKDSDGDGKVDQYLLHAEMEDHDGNGTGDSPRDDDAPDPDGLDSDIGNTLTVYDQQLEAQGR